MVVAQKRAKIITAVGAGGKSSYLKRRAFDYVRAGKRAVITTTTHIWKPDTAAGEGCIFHTADGIDYAGMLNENGKLSSPPADVWERLREQYDVILVEGDGSRCMPVKIPGPGEPVIPEDTDEIAVIMGTQAVGRRLDVVCHRYDAGRLESVLAAVDRRDSVDMTGARNLNGKPDRSDSPDLNGSGGVIVTERLLETIADRFYIRPLTEKYPGADVFYSPSEYVPHEERMPVTAVLLASGFSLRYGGNKLLDDFGGAPLYRRALDHVAQAVGREKIVVVTQYEKIMNEMAAEGITALRNSEAAEGISASIRIGTAEAMRRKDSEAVIFFAADMPFIPADEIRRYVDQFLWSGKLFGCMESGPDHVMTNPGAFRLYKTEEGTGPVRSEAAAQLLALSGDRGAMRIMKKHPKDIYRYQIAEEAVRDIDEKSAR